MKYAIVKNNVTDLRLKPSFKSERKSQLLYNEIIRVGKLESDYYDARLKDGYSGWVARGAVKLVSKNVADVYRGQLNCFIKSKVVSLKQNNNTPYVLYYGSRLALKSKRNGIGCCLDSNDNKYYVNLKHLQSVGDNKTSRITGGAIVREAEKFLGVPYLWGGKTPNGFDCSGLVQLIYSQFGIELPRDSKDQQECGDKILLSDTKAGDLFFFPGHVAIAIDCRRFIHASLKEGGVNINNFVIGNTECREDLHKSITSVRRVLL